MLLDMKVKHSVTPGWLFWSLFHTPMLLLIGALGLLLIMSELQHCRVIAMKQFTDFFAETEYRSFQVMGDTWDEVRLLRKRHGIFVEFILTGKFS